MAIEQLLQYLGLFFGCFLSATVIPFSSEAILSGMLVSGADQYWCLVWASLGNWGGGMLSYWLGYAGNAAHLEKYLRVDPDKLHRWEERISRWGIPAALLCWTPIVGDFIAVALGFFRVRTVPVAVLMLVGKTVRYIFVIFMVEYFI